VQKVFANPGFDCTEKTVDQLAARRECEFGRTFAQDDPSKCAVSTHKSRVVAQDVAIRIVFHLGKTSLRRGKVRNERQMKKEKWFTGFHHDLLISFSQRQFRQVLIKLVSWLLTEILEVRILSGQLGECAFSNIFL
jgi:hypothetical protein